MSSKIVFDRKYSDGQYKKTADNLNLKLLFPDFKFTEISEGIPKSIEWFIKNYAQIRK